MIYKCDYSSQLDENGDENENVNLRYKILRVQITKVLKREVLYHIHAAYFLLFEVRGKRGA